MSREMFNSEQNSYMDWLATQPPESLCYCGWYKLGECYNCRKDHPGKTNADKQRGAEQRGTE